MKTLLILLFLPVISFAQKGTVTTYEAWCDTTFGLVEYYLDSSGPVKSDGFICDCATYHTTDKIMPFNIMHDTSLYNLRYKVMKEHPQKLVFIKTNKGVVQLYSDRYYKLYAYQKID